MNGILLLEYEYPLVNKQKAIEHDPFGSLIYP